MGGLSFDDLLEGGVFLGPKTDVTARVSNLTVADQDLIARMDILVMKDSFLANF